MEIWPGEDDNVKCIIQAGLCQWLRNKQHPMQHWYREAGDSHHRVKEQDELPSVKHSNSHMAFVIKHQYKWVRPACGISGWEWNKLGQTASCSGSWRLTRNLHCPLHPSFWEGSLGPAQQECTKLQPGMSGLLHFHGSLTEQQSWAWVQQCLSALVPCQSHQTRVHERIWGISALHLLLLLLSWDPLSPGKGKLHITNEKKNP